MFVVNVAKQAPPVRIPIRIRVTSPHFPLVTLKCC